MQMLLGVEKYWLCEDKLLPMYSHLVDVCSEQIRGEWSNVATITTKVKQEPDDLETQTPQHKDVVNFDKEVRSFILKNVLIRFSFIF